MISPFSSSGLISPFSLASSFFCSSFLASFFSSLVSFLGSFLSSLASSLLASFFSSFVSSFLLSSFLLSFFSLVLSFSCSFVAGDATRFAALPAGLPFEAVGGVVAALPDVRRLWVLRGGDAALVVRLFDLRASGDDGGEDSGEASEAASELSEAESVRLRWLRRDVRLSGTVAARFPELERRGLGDGERDDSDSEAEERLDEEASEEEGDAERDLGDGGERTGERDGERDAARLRLPLRGGDGERRGAAAFSGSGCGALGATAWGGGAGVALRAEGAGVLARYGLRTTSDGGTDEWRLRMSRRGEGERRRAGEWLSGLIGLRPGKGSRRSGLRLRLRRKRGFQLPPPEPKSSREG